MRSIDDPTSAATEGALAVVVGPLGLFAGLREQALPIGDAQAARRRLMETRAERVDLDLEVDLARLSRADLVDAITRCSQCPDPGGCEIWLDEHRGGAVEAPSLCRNRALLDRLR